MNNLYYLIAIVKRSDEERYTRFFKENTLHTQFLTLCTGTARQKTLDLLGLEKSEKVMISMLIAGSLVKKVMSKLIREMNIDIPGNGIALTIPVESIGGTSGLNYLTNGQEYIIGEEGGRKMEETSYSLIVIISEKGTTDIVMEAARSVNANGGTVIHAKGTGAEYASKFFGVSIAAEKEMVYIVVRREDKNNVMRAIMEKAGMNTPAHSILFSLPVESIAGLRSLTPPDDDDTER